MASQSSNLITNLDSVPSVMNDVGKSGGRVRIQTDNFEINTATLTTAGDIARLCRIPTNARILSFVVWNDALDAADELVCDLGVYLTNSDTAISADATACIVDGTTVLQAAVVGAGTEFMGTVAADLLNIGKPIWEQAGYSSDPGGLFDICLTISTDCETDVAGATFAFRCMYTVD
ncbi:MAG: hypothetical protein Unbinned4614contig1000_1 [Prokaryotic dsDNA virus sp.]|nr:MAG: hypothetical protein Unbinned4614contig1000_1 [Prokaryotic dsDNA virus sp.]|tara:strand:- start:66 stop:593 length:528 start_codon:yes stop_codon:yes gene_type:complete